MNGCASNIAGGFHIFLSHPIQHFVPWLQKLSGRLDGNLMVHYASRQGLEARLDPEFGKSFAWEMDLLSGYQCRFWERKGSPQGPSRGFWGVRYPGLSSYMAQHRPKAILVWGWLYAGYWQAAWTARRMGIPYLLRGESNLLGRQSGLKWWLKQQTIGRLCRNADGCLAIGTRNAALYEAYGLKDNRIWVAPYFVDNAWFSAEATRLRKERARLRAKYGLPEDALVFLFMGKLIEKKRPNDLARAWAGLSQHRRERSALLISGSGELYEGMRKQWANESRIRFTGFLNRRELPEAYAAGDVLVLPSDAGETWGLVVNEAMASGLPVIVSDRVGCAPDLVRAGETGWTFACGDTTALTERIQWFVDNPDKLAGLGATAKAQINCASIDLAVDKTLEALQVAQAKTREKNSR